MLLCTFFFDFWSFSQMNKVHSTWKECSSSLVTREMAKLRKNTRCLSGSQAYLACDLGNENEKEPHKSLLVSSFLFWDRPEWAGCWISPFRVCLLLWLAHLCDLQQLWGGCTEKTKAGSAWEDRHVADGRDWSGLRFYKLPGWQVRKQSYYVYWWYTSGEVCEGIK